MELYVEWPLERLITGFFLPFLKVHGHVHFVLQREGRS